MADDISQTGPEMGGEPFDPLLQAGKYALGVLEGEELADARRMALADPKFAADVEWWSGRFGALAEMVGSVAPSDDVWSAIEARIDSKDGGAKVSEFVQPSKGNPSRWSIGSALAGAAAAALVLYITVPGMRSDARPDVQPPQIAANEPQLIAQLSDAENGRSIASRIDRDSGQLTLKVAGLVPQDTATTATELWVVPAGGVPRSLGLIPGEGEFTRSINTDEARLLIEGATLAVTFESREGAPHDAPSTPILLAGSLTEV